MRTHRKTVVCLNYFHQKFPYKLLGWFLKKSVVGKDAASSPLQGTLTIHLIPPPPNTQLYSPRLLFFPRLSCGLPIVCVLDTARVDSELPRALFKDISSRYVLPTRLFFSLPWIFPWPKGRTMRKNWRENDTRVCVCVLWSYVYY